MNILHRMTQLSSIIAPAALLLLSTPSLAANPFRASACPQPFGSFYVGLGVDRSSIFAKTSSKDDIFIPGSLPFPKPSITSESSGAWDGGLTYYGQLMLGYETRAWNCFNLAAEVFVAHTPALDEPLPGITDRDGVNPNRQQLTIGHTDLQLTTTYGVALLPGFKLQPNVTLFGQIGYVSTCTLYRPQSKKLGQEGTITGVAVFFDNFDQPVRENLCGINAGLGFNVRTSCHLNLRMGYYWTNYDEISSNFTLIDEEGINEVRKLRQRPQIENFVLSALYHFTPVTDYAKGCAHSALELYGGIFADRDTALAGYKFQRANARVTEPADINSVFSQSEDGLKGWGYELFAGCGYTFCNGAYTGAELFYGDTSAEYSDCGSSFIPADAPASQNGSSESSSKAELDCHYGIAFLSGYKFNDCVLLYGKVGYVKSSYHLKNTLAQDPATLRDLIVLNRVNDEDIYGYQLGIGLDIKVWNNLYLRNEYVITHYGNVNLGRKSSLPQPGDTTSFLLANEYDLKVLLTQYKLGLEYRFPV